MNNILSVFVILALMLGIFSCQSNERHLGFESDTHGRGKATILIEESFKPLFETSIYTFESQFPHADVLPKYMAEGDIINDFFADKVKTICISRDFTDAEKAALRKKNVEVRSDRIAFDAVTLIVHPENPDSSLTLDRLKSIIMGKDSVWPGLKSKINVVYDQVNSANFNYLRQLVGQNNLPANIFAVKSNAEVIAYVKKNKSAFGVIGLNWISDQDDFDVKDFMKGLKVMSVAESKSKPFFKPYAGLIYTREYPLRREIWMINKGKRSGIHTGFVLFMTGEKGQTIITKSALVPATAPVRLIQINTR
jgi:phosphate transport system substrate-binding protein